MLVTAINVAPCCSDLNPCTAYCACLFARHCQNILPVFITGHSVCSSQLAFGSPDSVHSHSQTHSPPAEASDSPAHPADKSQPLPQQAPLLQSATQPEGSQRPEDSPPPFTQLSLGRPVPQPYSSPMSIPCSIVPQAKDEQAPESSSAPSDLCGHMQRWAGGSSNRQEDGVAATHQLPQVSPLCHFEEGSAGIEGHHTVRRSALHGSRSGKGRIDSGSGRGHGILWNDSRDSLLSSQEDLAQLVPDRASSGGVEQSPEAVSLATTCTGQQLCRAAVFAPHQLHATAPQPLLLTLLLLLCFSRPLSSVSVERKKACLYPDCLCMQTKQHHCQTRDK